MVKKTIRFLMAVAACLAVCSCTTEDSTNKSAGNMNNETNMSKSYNGQNLTMEKNNPVKTTSLKTSAALNGFKTVSNGFFTFSMPANLTANTNSAEDEEYKVYEAKIFPVSSSRKMNSYIYVSYFAEDNEDIATWQEFVRVNSQNILRKGASSEWEKYEPVKETSLAGRKAYIVARNCRHFLKPNSKDDSYVMKKEKMYVLPASKGYYVIRYASDEKAFNENLKTFESIAASFKGNY